MRPSDYMDQMQKVTLDVISMRMQRMFSDREMYFAQENGNVRAYMDDRLRSLVIDIEVKLASRQFKDESDSKEVVFTYKVDADWWQSFRARWSPRWWLRKHPVKTRDVVSKQYVDRVVKVFNVCPHLKQKVYNQQDHIQFVVTAPSVATLRMPSEFGD
jgi:hypothetical protein